MGEADADHRANHIDAAEEATDVPIQVEGEKWPVGFILTIVMVSLYLIYRIIQGGVLIFDWIF